jgi:hypothetical protein
MKLTKLTNQLSTTFSFLLLVTLVRYHFQVNKYVKENHLINQQESLQQTMVMQQEQ